MKRLIFTLLALVLIVLLLNESMLRITESLMLFIIGVALFVIERLFTALSRRASSGVRSVSGTGAVHRLPRVSYAPGRRHDGIRRHVCDGATLALPRAVTWATVQHRAVSYAAPGYRVLAYLRRTALHEVVLAHTLHANRHVIIKRTLPGAPSHDLRREAGMLFWLEWARMPIPAPRYLAYDERDGRSTLMMTYIDGQTIDELTSSGRLVVSELIRLLAKTCAALDTLHRAGYVHQDIKPANLILDRSGTLVVIDWGSARRYDLPYDPHSITCTPEFASPEQLRGLVLPDNDLYAVGKTLEVLVPAPPLALARVIARATGPFAQRYTTGADLAEALLAAAQ